MAGNEWEPVTHLIHICMNNHTGLEWGIELGLYTNEDRTMCRGGSIGRIINGEFVQNENEKEYFYRLIWTAAGHVIVVRKKKGQS